MLLQVGSVLKIRENIKIYGKNMSDTLAYTFHTNFFAVITF